MQHALKSPEEITTTGMPEIAPLRFPAADVFAARATRLRQLANGHTMADFLNFAALLCDAQQAVLKDHAATRPSDELIERCRRHGMPPLDAHGAALDAGWQQRLASLVDLVATGAPAHLANAIALLRVQPGDTLDTQARAILRIEEDGLDLATAPFIAAALQVEWTALARSLRPADFTIGMETSLCPVCGSHPVASTIRIGDAGHGIRYAMCSLCASEWHVTRVKCVPCMDTKDIHTLALEGADGSSAHPAVKVETCDACHSSLKLISMEKDPLVDPFADDLATLALDMLAEEEGFHRAGRNLFLFSGA